MIEDKEIGEKADKFVKEKRGFYIHFIIYLIVNTFLFLQWWYITGGEGFLWIITTTAGWGIGVIAHFISVFVMGSK
ncbi:MAG: hypothetical protein A3K77_01025 [Euryarchaeota archaeon RBG_13_31_8]|nr:MAG: hypothetical protein A3K77_01025 [Euryarchaeota archaeon RBG_13_31_8]